MLAVIVFRPPTLVVAMKTLRNDSISKREAIYGRTNQIARI